MRTVISLLVTTFFFGSLALERQNNLRSEFSAQVTIASKTLSKATPPKRPRQPLPHRGSGRRSFTEYFVNPSPAV
ncbi:hypothetical protein NIES4071_56510 [Calothrix sp. NIES-4071]|nr:hypothetical protein NIES4071_56510 [Calothrix sp. NIES-4071]BAZ59958.1 hypothetical protein NIES4105_56460 [Calothrix sp. NIES-4105]